MNAQDKNDKLNKFANWSLYVFLLSVAYIGSCYAIYWAYGLSLGENDFTNWIIAYGTFVSAIGLVIFSYLTYKNQKNSEFYELCQRILNEHNRLLEIITKDKYVLYLTHSIVQTYLNNYKKRFYSERYIDSDKNWHEKEQHSISDESVYENYALEQINKNQLIRPYFIVLFRLLKLIYLSNKVDFEDKRECYGLVRSLIPANILFLVLFNAVQFNKQKSPNYVELLIQSSFFEHLPINQEWITKQFRINPLTSEGGSDPEPTDKVILAFEEYIFSGKFIDSKVFGESIYLQSYLEGKRQQA